MSPTLHLVLNRTWPVRCFFNIFIFFLSPTACSTPAIYFYIDYLTVNDPTLQSPLNDSQKADMYAEFATGGESGWDFSSRFYAGSTSTLGGLLRLNGRNIVGPDLNGIICEFSPNIWSKQLRFWVWFNYYTYTADKNHLSLAKLYASSNTTAADRHLSAAESLKAGILDLLWDSEKVCFYALSLI